MSSRQELRKFIMESLPKWKWKQQFSWEPPPPGGPKGTSADGPNTGGGDGDETNSYGHHRSPRGYYVKSKGGT